MKGRFPGHFVWFAWCGVVVWDMAKRQEAGSVPKEKKIASAR